MTGDVSPVAMFFFCTLSFQYIFCSARLRETNFSPSAAASSLLLIHSGNSQEILGRVLLYIEQTNCVGKHLIVKESWINSLQIIICVARCRGLPRRLQITRSLRC